MDKRFYRWQDTNDGGFHIDPPKAPGCYAVYFIPEENLRRRKLVYIGMAHNLFKRLAKNHSVLGRFKNTNHLRACKIRPTKNIDVAFYLERKLIARLNPPLNKQFRTS